MGPGGYLSSAEGASPSLKDAAGPQPCSWPCHAGPHPCKQLLPQVGAGTQATPGFGTIFRVGVGPVMQPYLFPRPLWLPPPGHSILGASGAASRPCCLLCLLFAGPGWG